VSGVGIIVNPWAGKDVRRLHAPVGHTSDSAKIGIVRQIAIGALEAGAARVVAARDTGRIAERALDGLARTSVVDGPGTGSALDTRRGASQLAALGCRPLVVLGGDGTCRDVAIGSPDSPMIAVSTGTNNVFPVFVDGSSAGAAAGLLSREGDGVDLGAVVRRAKQLHVSVVLPDGSEVEDIALVDVALTTDTRTGARAVLRPSGITAVIAAIATPASTGLSAIAGRVRPIGRAAPGAVAVRLGGTRLVRVPIVPGSFDDVAVGEVTVLGEGDSCTLTGPGALAYDGERDRLLPAGATATVTVCADGPPVVDVDRTLHGAARRHLFDAGAHPAGRSRRPTAGSTPERPEGSHGR
jgi:hypothetical protein